MQITHAFLGRNGRAARVVALVGTLVVIAVTAIGLILERVAWPFVAALLTLGSALVLVARLAFELNLSTRALIVRCAYLESSLSDLRTSIDEGRTRSSELAERLIEMEHAGVTHAAGLDELRGDLSSTVVRLSGLTEDCAARAEQRHDEVVARTARTESRITALTAKQAGDFAELAATIEAAFRATSAQS